MSHQLIITTHVTPIGRDSSRVQCTHCHADIKTKVKRTPTGRTHCWALILCLFLCWPCVCLPYCMKSCQNAEHSCPDCGHDIGTYKN